MRGFHSACSDQAGLYFVDSIEFLMGFEPHFGRFWIVFGRGDGGSEGLVSRYNSCGIR
jgi:hypothetical protein